MIDNIIMNIMLKIKVVHSSKGRLRLSIPISKKIPEKWQYDRTYLDYFLKIKGFKALDFSYITGNLLITYDYKIISEEEILDLIQDVINISKENIKDLSKFTSDEKDEAYEYFISLVDTVLLIKE